MLILYPDRLKRDLAAAVANAAAGGKRNAGYAVLMTAFPAGSAILLLREGVTVFASTIQALSIENGVLYVPRRYGDLTTYTVADIDTGTWSLKITNGNNSITGTVGFFGSGAPFTVSGDFAAGTGVAFDLTSFSLPASLDANPAPAPTPAPSPTPIPPPAPTPSPAPAGAMSISNMLQQMSGESTQPQFGTHRSAHAYSQYPVSHDTVVAACNWQGQERCKFDEYYNAMDVWCWVYYGPGNTSSGKRVQIRNLRYSLLRNSNNTWENFAVENHMGGGGNLQAWKGITTTIDLGQGSFSQNLRRENDGDSVILSTADMGMEVWADGFSLVNDRAKMVNSRAWAASCQIRVINDARDSNGNCVPYTGTDAKFVVALGYDIFFSGSPPGNQGNYGQHGAGSTGQEGYPRSMVDGGRGRWMAFDGSSGWVDVGHFSAYTECRETTHGLNAMPPFGDWGSPYWPYSRAPYAFTEAQIRANPPSWLV